MYWLDLSGTTYIIDLFGNLYPLVDEIFKKENILGVQISAVYGKRDIDKTWGSFVHSTTVANSYKYMHSYEYIKQCYES